MRRTLTPVDAMVSDKLWSGRAGQWRSRDAESRGQMAAERRRWRIRERWGSGAAFLSGDVMAEASSRCDKVKRFAPRRRPCLLLVG